MKKRLSLILAMIMILCSVVVNGESFSLLEVGGHAKVIEVIDGDSIKVKMKQTSQIAMIRLLGIDAKGYDNAVTYLNNTILGKTVVLSFDSNIPRVRENRWNNMYVTCDGVLINEELVSKGYAVANDEYRNASKFASLEDKEYRARQDRIEMWDNKNNPKVNNINSGGNNWNNGGNWNNGDDWWGGNGNSGSGSNTININTASSADLTSFLDGVSTGLAQEIISYRNKNPFNTILEIKFVPGMTKQIYNSNRNRMVVCTNINAAGSRELSTLNSLSSTDVNKIIDYRDRYSFTNVADLYKSNLISESNYNAIKPYVSLNNINKIDHRIPDLNVSLLRVTEADLTTAGLTSHQALGVVSCKELSPGYTYKTLQELGYLSVATSAALRVTDVNAIEDNVFVPSSENTTYTNINTATKQQLMSVGMSDAEADLVITRQGFIYSGMWSPIDLTLFDSRVALYTNINAAGTVELYTLGADMSGELVNAIIDARKDQPFGSAEEVKAIFETYSKGDLYNKVQFFIVIR